MNLIGWLQLSVFIIALAALTKPLGLYLVRVFDPGARTFLDPVLKPVERLLYRFLGIDPTDEQDWKSYAASLLIFSVVGMLFTYGILRLQQCAAAQSPGIRARLIGSGVQYECQFHNEHKLAELCRREHDVIFFPDGCTHLS